MQMIRHVLSIIHTFFSVLVYTAKRFLTFQQVFYGHRLNRFRGVCRWCVVNCFQRKMHPLVKRFAVLLHTIKALYKLKYRFPSITLRCFADAFRHKPDCFTTSLLSSATPGKAPALS